MFGRKSLQDQVDNVALWRTEIENFEVQIRNAKAMQLSGEAGLARAKANLNKSRRGLVKHVLGTLALDVETDD